MRLTSAQMDEVDAQAKTIVEDSGMEAVEVNFGPEVQDKWLEHVAVISGRRAVEFVYTYPRHSVEEPERKGLEVTIYNRNGDVVSSQDFG